jgi:hypothetical protein
MAANQGKSLNTMGGGLDQQSAIQKELAENKQKPKVSESSVINSYRV